MGRYPSLSINYLKMLSMRGRTQAWGLKIVWDVYRWMRLSYKSSIRCIFSSFPLKSVILEAFPTWNQKVNRIHDYSNASEKADNRLESFETDGKIEVTTRVTCCSVFKIGGHSCFTIKSEPQGLASDCSATEINIYDRFYYIYFEYLI